MVYKKPIISTESTQIRTISLILVVFLGIIFLSYFYFGITNLKAVSPDYNIPIAKTILSGEFLNIQTTHDRYIYFPGSSHYILAAFLFLRIPVNLFGVLSWIILFIACKKLGDTFKLDADMSILFASSIVTTMTVIRTINDQSIDKWLCAWFVFAMVLLERPKPTMRFSILLGLMLGMLVGTKYSGPLFFLALVPFYIRPLLQVLNPLRFLILSIVFTLSGLFWYIRNFVFEGSPQEFLI